METDALGEDLLPTLLRLLRLESDRFLINYALLSRSVFELKVAEVLC